MSPVQSVLSSGSSDATLVDEDLDRVTEETGALELK